MDSKNETLAVIQYVMLPLSSRVPNFHKPFLPQKVLMPLNSLQAIASGWQFKHNQKFSASFM